MDKDEIRIRIRRAQEELKTAGTIHKKDLIRHIRRLQKMLQRG